MDLLTVMKYSNLKAIGSSYNNVNSFLSLTPL